MALLIGQEAVKLEVGTRVRHEKFCDGTVQRLEGHGDMMKITVVFGRRDSRKFVARYARLAPEHPDWAECAIVVADEIQQRGLGSLLMNRLGHYAYSHGVKGFVGTVHLTNSTMLRFIKRAGLPYEKTIIEPGIWEVRVQFGG